MGNPEAHAQQHTWQKQAQVYDCTKATFPQRSGHFHSSGLPGLSFQYGPSRRWVQENFSFGCLSKNVNIQPWKDGSFGWSIIPYTKGLWVGSLVGVNMGGN